MGTVLMLIVFFGTAIIGWNSVVKLNVAVFQRKVTLRYVLKHLGIIVLTVVAALVLLWSIQFLPKSLRF
jgi:hypothetical protein